MGLSIERHRVGGAGCGVIRRRGNHATIALEGCSFLHGAFKGGSPKLGENSKLGESLKLSPDSEESLKLSPKMGESFGREFVQQERTGTHFCWCSKLSPNWGRVLKLSPKSEWSLECILKLSPKFRGESHYFRALLCYEQRSW